jgi:M6 family metalloprotease-like protein/uncharacterized repeat protein (TIGR02543 family)
MKKIFLMAIAILLTGCQISFIEYPSTSIGITDSSTSTNTGSSSSSTDSSSNESSSSSDTSSIESSLIESSSSITFNTYTITFHLNGGIGEESQTYRDIDETFELYTPTRIGYTFAGWYKNNVFTGQPVTEITKGTTGDKQFWAKWEIVEYTITYHLNLGIGANNSTYNIETETFALDIPTRSGYAFLGWYNNSELSGDAISEIVIGSSGNKEFWALWEILTSYSITYHLNGGIGADNSSYNVQTPTFSLPTPTRGSYVFSGWYLNSVFTGQVVTEIIQGSTGNKEYWAKWVAVEYTITYNLNGGNGASNSTYTIETPTITLPSPNKSAYTFAGWYTNSGLTGQNVTTIPVGSTGNKVFYAKWTPISYTITYNLNGGTGVSNSTYTIESPTVNLPTPTKSGQTFSGWYDNSSFTGSNVTTIASGSTGNKEFWAKWQAGQNYTVIENGTITLSQVEKGAWYSKGIPPYKGNLNVLIIPVHFADSTTCQSAEKGRAGNCAQVKEDIQTTFFGTEAQTGWESLSTYYSKSSYGSLNITGTISDWYTSTYTKAQFQDMSLPSNTSYNSQVMLRNAVAWYKTQVSTNLSEFDLNNDNMLDVVYLVYDNAINNSAANSSQWAYKYYDYGAPSASSSNRQGYQYMWASMNFMYEDPNYTVDAHTFIHETGHLLNLDDYYNTDYGGTYPAGGLDMQDYNIGDQNAYSKFLLDWIDPMVVNNSGTIDLRPFESSGDAIIIPATSFNNSAYDEYLMLEYVTPTGLNYRDSHQRYGGNYPFFYQTAGLRVWHVDSRLAKNTGSGAYTSTYSSGSYTAHSNTPSRSKNSNIALIQLISKNGTNFFSQTSRQANSTDLFVQGDSFNPTGTNYTNQFIVNHGKFNTNTAIGYTFTITYLGTDKISIQFTKL